MVLQSGSVLLWEVKVMFDFAGGTADLVLQQSAWQFPLIDQSSLVF